jgi:hypothetical protein
LFISSKEVETVVGRELAVRLCDWIRAYTPVSCKVGQGEESALLFDIDEAIAFSKIKMRQDTYKREFFPYLVKLKQYKVCSSLEAVCSA